MSLQVTTTESDLLLNAGDRAQQRAQPGSLPTDQWDSLRAKIRSHAKNAPPSQIFADAAGQGRVYRWGVAVACGEAIDPLWDVVSRLAADQKVSKKQLARIDLAGGADCLMDELNMGATHPLDAARATLWAAAMPGLIKHLGYTQWWDLLSALQQYREAVTSREACHEPSYLIAGAELGLTLAWRLADLPSCSRLQKSSIQCLSQWCKQDQESIASSISGATSARIVLASLIRCKKILQSGAGQEFKKRQARVASGLAHWVAAMTTHTGGSAMSFASRGEVRDDVGAGGLLPEVIACDPESLQPAVDAALGKRQVNGRLAWEICLPESFQHCEQAKIAVLMPQWDVRRGRVQVDYQARQTCLELMSGKSMILSGKCQTSLQIGDQVQQPIDQWESTCEFTDDDVHYLELEQAWSGGIVLQRQLMVVRDDRCVLLADSVLPSETRRRPDSDLLIHYSNRIPLARGVHPDPEAETREYFLSDGRRRGLVIPLSAPEWKMGASSTELKMSDDNHLSLSASGRGSLFAPLWFDFQQRRFDRTRTWRQLTVADNLRIVAPHEAVGFRVQVGSEQWMIYRSLAKPTNRSVLGKHIVADFYAARFYTSDGSLEELVTVDSEDPADD